VEPFRIHVADEVLNDLRARLHKARWPDQIPGIGWKQGTELDWLRRIVSYWANEFDWRGWERRLNAFNHFTSEGVHFVYQRAPSGQGVPLILTHGWPSSFLDYMDMLPMLEDFDVVVPSCPGMVSRRVHPRSASTIGTSPSVGTDSCLSLGIPAMVRVVMTLGPG
jgi:hypothetical protein